MANMTLRLSDEDEIELDKIMNHYGESTKSKALIKMINKHMEEIKYHREFSSQAAENARAYAQVVEAIKEYDKAKQNLNDYLI